MSDHTPPGYDDLLQFGLVEALLGRRSRRFFRGAEIPDGHFAYASRHPPLPLSPLETALVVSAVGGNTGWHHLIKRADRYAPKLSSYAGAAGGRTFPSAAGFHTSLTFYTDDHGTHLLDVRDAPALVDRDGDGHVDARAFLAAHGARVRTIDDHRLALPSEPPFIEPHNTWVVNRPGTTLITPVGDLAQHVILGLCYMLQNGLFLFDDIHGCPVPGIERFADLADPAEVWPITFVEHTCLAELTVELSTACYAGALLLQGMGLGGWLFDGVDPYAFLGASGVPEAPGLGFRYDADPRWATPNPTGRPGVMEAHCPPHFPDMRAAVEAVVRRKFGPGGPFHPDTPGPFRDTAKVRGAASPHGPRFVECVAHQAQYVFDAFGKFPGIVPSIFVLTHLQAHHLDVEFYDRFYAPGAYLETHAHHLERWHPELV